MLSLGQETWKFRALIEALVRRHVATRYRGSMFGFLWSFLNPMCLMAIYTLVFHYYMRFDGGPPWRQLTQISSCRGSGRAAL